MALHLNSIASQNDILSQLAPLVDVALAIHHHRLPPPSQTEDVATNEFALAVYSCAADLCRRGHPPDIDFLVAPPSDVTAQIVRWMADARISGASRGALSKALADIGGFDPRTDRVWDIDRFERGLSSRALALKARLRDFQNATNQPNAN